MAIDITKTLRKALVELQAEQRKISGQIAAIEKVLAADSRGRQRRRGRVQRPGKVAGKRMSAAARKAVSRRMKASWAKRKAEAAKGRGQDGK